MTRGSLSIARRVGLWSRTPAVQMHLAALAVGVLAGLAAALIKLRLGMPGHKALFWMIPLLATRLTCGCRLGTTFGSAAAAGTTLLLGANLAGGPAGAFLIVLAGAMLDAAARWTETRRLALWLALPLLAGTGLLGNLLCMGKRLLSPSYESHALLGLTGFQAVLLSYALFGLAAGALGAAIGLAARRCKQP